VDGGREKENPLRRILLRATEFKSICSRLNHFDFLYYLQIPALVSRVLCRLAQSQKAQIWITMQGSQAPIIDSGVTCRNTSPNAAQESEFGDFDFMVSCCVQSGASRQCSRFEV